MYEGSIIQFFIIVKLCFKYYYAFEDSNYEKFQKFGCDHSIFNYQRSLNWVNMQEFKQWLKLVINVKYPLKCKNSKSKKQMMGFEVNDDQLEKPLRGPHTCKDNSRLVLYKGSKNNHKLPHGLGKMIKIESPLKNNTTRQTCYNMSPNIKSINGKFVKGILHGKAIIKYTNNAYMEASFINGILQGNKT